MHYTLKKILKYYKYINCLILVKYIRYILEARSVLYLFSY